MVKRVTIYGWAINDDPVYGKGSGSLVDLVYFVDLPSTVSNDYLTQQIFNMIETQGYKILPKRIGGRYSPVEQDKITVEDWDSHIRQPNITVGIEENRSPQR
jgi:hypothetical protein